MADEETKVYALNLFDIADREEYLAYSRRSAREVARHGGRVLALGRFRESAAGDIAPRQVLILVEWESGAAFESYRQGPALADLHRTICCSASAGPRRHLLPVWLNGAERHGLFRGRDDDHPHHPGPAGVITAGLLRAAGVTVTGVDIDELDPALTAGPGPWHGPEAAQATARIELTAAGTAEPRQITVRIGYALAMAAATGAPVRVAGPLMDQVAVRAEDDLVGQVTGDVPLPR